jgi:hypothetical protein
MVKFGADYTNYVFSLLKLSMNLESLNTTKAVEIIKKIATCFFLNVLAFWMQSTKVKKFIKKKLFTVDNFSKGLFSVDPKLV